MDTLVSKYANSACSASFDDADNLGENLAGWDAATKFALPAFDIPMVANVCFIWSETKKPRYCKPFRTFVSDLILSPLQK